MTILQLDRNATFTWSPVFPLSFAVATAANTMNQYFDASSCIEIFSLNVSNEGINAPLHGRVNCPEKVSQIIWTPFNNNDELKNGIIATASANTVSFWNPTSILENNSDGALLITADKHRGQVNSIEFNPFQHNLMASGSSNSETLIWDLHSPLNPTAFVPGNLSHQGERTDITSVAWNKKVPHILSATPCLGRTVIWDLKNKKPAVTLFEPSRRAPYTVAAWHPEEALQIVLGSNDDKAPLLHNWDLRYNQTPLMAFEGHKQGVQALSWCNFDSRLLLSAGKDKTICWNTQTGSIISEIDKDGGISNSWNYDVQWSYKPSILSTCSLDGKVKFHSLYDINPPKSTMPPGRSLAPPPKWAKRPICGSFGWGGKFIYTSLPKKKPTDPAVVNITSISSTDDELAERARVLDEVVANRSFDQFCDQKIQTASSDDEANTWALIRCHLQKENCRRELLNQIGQSSAAIEEEIRSLLPNLRSEEAVQEQEAPVQEPPKVEETQPVIEDPFASINNEEKHEADVSNLFGASGDDFDVSAKTFSSDPFSNLALGSAAPLVSEVTQDIDKQVRPISLTSHNEADSLITKALLIGNFELAVDCCLKLGRMADALMLAEYGSPELRDRTRDIYFNQRTRTYIAVLGSIIKGNLQHLAQTAELSSWRKILAILCTYSTGENFPSLVDGLANRLEADGEYAAATVCYICSGNFEKVLLSWISKAQKNSNIFPLQDLMEKVVIYRSAVDNNYHSDLIVEKFCQYAEYLGSQGQQALALRFLSLIPQANHVQVKILKDRLNLRPTGGPVIGYQSSNTQTQTNNFPSSTSAATRYQPTTGGFHTQTSGFAASAAQNSVPPPSTPPTGGFPPTGNFPPTGQSGLPSSGSRYSAAAPPTGTSFPTSTSSTSSSRYGASQPVAPPPTSFTQTPPATNFGQPPRTNFTSPPTATSNFGPPPTNFNQPPPTTFAPPPTSNYGPPPTNTSFTQPPPTNFAPPPTNTSFAQPPPTNFAQPPPTNFAPPTNSSFAQPPSTNFSQPPVATGPPTFSTAPSTFATAPPTFNNQPTTLSNFGGPNTSAPPSTNFGTQSAVPSAPPAFGGQPSTSFSQPPPTNFSQPLSGGPPSTGLGVPAAQPTFQSAPSPVGPPSGQRRYAQSNQTPTPPGSFGTPAPLVSPSPPTSFSGQVPQPVATQAPSSTQAPIRTFVPQAKVDSLPQQPSSPAPQPAVTPQAPAEPLPELHQKVIDKYQNIFQKFRLSVDEETATQTDERLQDLFNKIRERKIDEKSLASLLEMADLHASGNKREVLEKLKDFIKKQTVLGSKGVLALKKLLTA